MTRKKFVLILGLCILLIFAVLLAVRLCFSIRNADDFADRQLTEAVMFNDRLYYFDGLSLPLHPSSSGAYVDGREDTFLPDGFTEIGEITTVNCGLPTKNLEMCVGIGSTVTGTVFVNDDAPEVVYVLMSTDIFDGKYTRFVSEKLISGYWISLFGNLYFMDKHNTERVDALPDGCISAGKLRFIGLDRLPENDLETNCQLDIHALNVDGREVLYDPADLTVIYMYEPNLSKSGQTDGWRVCRLEGTVNLSE